MIGDILRDKDYRTALYRQTIFESGGRRFRRFIQIADLKYCGITSSGASAGENKSRILLDWPNFNREMDIALKDFRRICMQRRGKPSYPEVYATLAWFYDPGVGSGITYSMNKTEVGGWILPPVGYDLVIDLDTKDNAWLLKEVAFTILSDLVSTIERTIGVTPTVTFGNGVQIKATIIGAWVGLGVQVVDDEVLARAVRRVVEYVADAFGRKWGIVLRYDNIYDGARVTRLDLSLHMGLTGEEGDGKRLYFAIPVKPDVLETLSWEDIRKMQTDTGLVLKLAREHNGLWGVVKDMKKLMNAIDLSLTIVNYNPPKIFLTTKTAKPVVSSRGGWPEIYVEGIGNIAYDPILEGFNWAYIIVKRRIILPDGKKKFLWAVAPALINGARTKDGEVVRFDITEEDIRAWIEANAVALGVDPMEYIRKFTYNKKYKYNIPTWRHLLKGVGEDGRPLSGVFQELRDIIIRALEQAGLVKVGIPERTY